MNLTKLTNVLQVVLYPLNRYFIIVRLYKYFSTNTQKQGPVFLLRYPEEYRLNLFPRWLFLSF